MMQDQNEIREQKEEPVWVTLLFIIGVVTALIAFCLFMVWVTNVLFPPVTITTSTSTQISQSSAGQTVTTCTTIDNVTNCKTITQGGE